MANLEFKYYVKRLETDNAQTFAAQYGKKNKNVLLLGEILPNDNIIKLVEDQSSEKKVDVIVVDNCHLCSKKQIEQLREVAEDMPVICFGLKNNFKSELFEGSKRLFELADSTNEIEINCECGKKAIVNARFHKKMLVVDDPEKFDKQDVTRPLCFSCYKKERIRRKIYDKLICHIAPLENKQVAGKWSDETALDNVVMHKPFVIYDEEVESFLADFKQFQARHPQELLLVSDSAQDLTKLQVKNKSFEYMMTLITYVLKLENNHAGLLKALIENGTIAKWLKQIKKAADNM